LIAKSKKVFDRLETPDMKGLKVAHMCAHLPTVQQGRYVNGRVRAATSWYFQGGMNKTCFFWIPPGCVGNCFSCAV